MFLVCGGIFTPEKSTPVSTELAISVGHALVLPGLLRTASGFSRAR